MARGRGPSTPLLRADAGRIEGAECFGRRVADVHTLVWTDPLRGRRYSPCRSLSNPTLTRFSRPYRAFDRPRFTEQREILEELSAHLRDAVALREAEGLDPDDAHARAIASMGDPDSIGLRLRAEHLYRRLSLRATIVALLPLLIIVWAFSHSSYIGMVRQAGAGPNNSVDVIFGNLLPVAIVAARPLAHASGLAGDVARWCRHLRAAGHRPGARCDQPLSLEPGRLRGRWDGWSRLRSASRFAGGICTPHWPFSAAS